MRRRHPVNDDVTGDAHGIWGGDDLPILIWEDPNRRVVLPQSLIRELPTETPVMRWSAEKIDALSKKRADVLPILDRLSYEIENWSTVGVEHHTGNWRVLFEGSDRRHYAISFGKDNQGSWNAITIVGSSNASFWMNRKKGMVNPKDRS